MEILNITKWPFTITLPPTGNLVLIDVELILMIKVLHDIKYQNLINFESPAVGF
jgi:hypothetical protein